MTATVYDFAYHRQRRQSRLDWRTWADRYLAIITLGAVGFATFYAIAWWWV